MSDQSGRMNNKYRKERIRLRTVRWSTNALKNFILVILAIISLYPLFFVFINSVKGRGDYAGNKVGLPEEFVFAGYEKVFLDERFMRWLGNTLLLTFASVMICLLFAGLAAFALSKMRFPGRSFTLSSIIALMVMPVIVMIIPLFVSFGKLNLNNNYLGVIIIYVGVLLPFNIYLLYSYFVTVPESILDSARIDGCNSFQIFSRIMIHLARPAFMALLVVDVLWVWNELIISLIFLQKENMRTLMVGLTLFQGRFTKDVPLIMAGLVTGIIPILILYIFTQRYFVRGLVAGSIKE